MGKRIFPIYVGIRFAANRNPEVYQLFFETMYSKPTAVDIKVQKENSKVLLSNSIFKMENKSYKLIVLHNIEDTLNKTEADAWKKLLSVMTLAGKILIGFQIMGQVFPRK